MRSVLALSFLLAVTPVYAAKTLTIVSAGPVGETATLAETNEIRVVFSEPMVVLGKIPKEVVAPFFRISPAVAGTFRWSGTTTLIFTPSAKLPYATRYEVTIDQSAASVAGNTLDQTYKFSFTTPTIQLRRTNWYRKNGRFDAPVVIALYFNQPVDGETVARHVQLRTVAHPIEVPGIPEAGRKRLAATEPEAITAFEAKRDKALRAAASDGAVVLSFLAMEWDKNRFRPAPELVVLETKPGVAPDTVVRVVLGADVARAATNVRPGRAQSYEIRLDPTLFVDEPHCPDGCDPEMYVPLVFRTPVTFEKLKKALTVIDVTDPAKEVPVKAKTVERDYNQSSTGFSLDELGYTIQPAHDYLVRVDASLEAADGQKLGYTWMGVIEYWHKSAFISFGEGQGVWETSGGPVMPFSARNYKTVRQWLQPVSIAQLMPILRELEKNNFTSTPDGAPQTRTLKVINDKIQAHGLNIKPAVGDDNLGLLWAAIAPGVAIPMAKTYEQPTRALVAQVTNLGLSVKDSPQNTFILVTRLDNAAPVAGVNVSIRDFQNKVLWSGVTDARGVAMAPAFPDLRTRPTEPPPAEQPPITTPDEESDEEQEEWFDTWSALGELRFVVVAEKDGDTAYVASNWNEGIQPWDFETEYNLFEASPLLRGTIFSDRGVYKLGEEVHFKAIVRSDTPAGIQLLPAGTQVKVVVRDTHNQKVDERTVTTNAWSSAEWTFKLPADAPLGNYSVSGRVDGQRQRVHGSLLVAAYRRPDFRVDATLTAPSSIAGVALQGTITGRYLFGAPMSGRDVTWAATKSPLHDVPRSITDRWPAERFTFLGWDTKDREKVKVAGEEAELDAKGVLRVTVPTERGEGWPYQYTIEGQVTDVSRQVIAGRASFRVDPAPWYIGVKNLPYFAESGKGVDTEIIAAGLDGLAVPGIPVKVELIQVQWNSVRKAIGNGFYEWETERKEVPAGNWSVTTAAQPVPLHIPLQKGGQFFLVASAGDGEGRSTATRVWFYASGEGYTAWERYDHNRIDLVSEKKTYRPGETARIMIKSPWERATAVLTTERESVRTHRTFELTSTQETVEVPITEKDIPNVFVSVHLVRGRTKEGLTADGDDPGKPAFRLGYLELFVEEDVKRLNVSVNANKEEYRPATKARVDVEVKDVAGKGTASEVTLWAVDYGVLSLTAYQTPDVLGSIYIRKALQVATEDSRQRIVSRRVITPKGASEEGDGGRDAGPGMMRKDFRVLAFWLGSLVTDARGKARTEVTLPESLTTYRIMAVASDKASRFGLAQTEIRVNKPLLLAPAMPRFMAVGDKAFFGSVVHSQLARAGKATVTMRSLDPNVIEIGNAEKQIDLPAKGSAEVRFDAVAKSIGTARIQMSVRMGSETDAYEDVIPVRILVSPETVAAYGSTQTEAKETLEIPSEVVPGFGGMQLEMASTAMVGLGEGARYLVEYPYGCAEQRASAAMGLVLASDLGAAFQLPGIRAENARTVAQSTLDELVLFQCPDGGFTFWPGQCHVSSPYLTSYIVHVYQQGQKLKYTVKQDVLERAYSYLENSLNDPKPPNEGWWPGFTSWQAFAVKTLTEGGRNADSHITRIYGYVDRMPVFGIAFLTDALIAKGEKGARLTELRRRIMNSILTEGGSAHVEELKDEHLLWFWNSNVRSTAITLATLVRSGGDVEMIRRIVRWMMSVREDGRWGNTQENAWAMESLVDYYRRYESEVPDFTGTVSIGTEPLLTQTFKGRSTEAKTQSIAMPQVLAKAPAGQKLPITVAKQGTGTLFYMMRLRYAAMAQMLDAMNQGFALTRTYSKSPFKAGELIEVTLTIRNTKERRYVAVTDPIPAGTEPVESWFATTATELNQPSDAAAAEPGNWTAWFERGGFDHVERHDDRVELFATRLSAGTHTFKYMLRATTAGTFVTAPMHAEEMYEPEVFGRTSSTTVEVKP